jgi:hypothetical protein
MTRNEDQTALDPLTILEKEEAAADVEAKKRLLHEAVQRLPSRDRHMAKKLLRGQNISARDLSSLSAKIADILKQNAPPSDP